MPNNFRPNSNVFSVSHEDPCHESGQLHVTDDSLGYQECLETTLDLQSVLKNVSDDRMTCETSSASLNGESSVKKPKKGLISRFSYALLNLLR